MAENRLWACLKETNVDWWTETGANCGLSCQSQKLQKRAVIFCMTTRGRLSRKRQNRRNGEKKSVFSSLTCCQHTNATRWRIAEEGHFYLWGQSVPMQSRLRLWALRVSPLKAQLLTSEARSRGRMTDTYCWLAIIMFRQPQYIMHDPMLCVPADGHTCCRWEVDASVTKGTWRMTGCLPMCFEWTNCHGFSQLITRPHIQLVIA